jgi:SPP1 gp7 family putative phage head morphogenesis protein
MARRLFREDRDALLALLPSGKAARKDGAVQVFWALAFELLTQRKDAWRGEFVSLFTAVIAEQAEAIEAQFGIAFDVRNPKVAEFIDSYTYKFLERTGATTNDALRELMLRADAEGMTVPELQTQLRELYDGWSETRAEQISRSETIRASNYGAREGYRQAGVRRIQWMTAQDERLCEWCAPLNGKTVGIEEVYFHQGDVYSVADAEGVAHDMKLDYEDVGAPPLHVACRCTIVPVIEDD